MAFKKKDETTLPTVVEAVEAPAPEVPERIPNAPTPVPLTTLEQVLAAQAAAPCETCGGRGVTDFGTAGTGATLCPSCKGTGRVA